MPDNTHDPKPAPTARRNVYTLTHSIWMPGDEKYRAEMIAEMKRQGVIFEVRRAP